MYLSLKINKFKERNFKKGNISISMMCFCCLLFDRQMVWWERSIVQLPLWRRRILIQGQILARTRVLHKSKDWGPMGRASRVVNSSEWQSRQQQWGHSTSGIWASGSAACYAASPVALTLRGQLCYRKCPARRRRIVRPLELNENPQIVNWC